MTKVFRVGDDRWTAPDGPSKPYLKIETPEPADKVDPVIVKKGRVCGMGDRCQVTWKLTEGDEVRYSCDFHLVANALFFNGAIMITQEKLMA
jgi:hypothetical protein